MSMENDYETLFATLQRIADAEPNKVPQLLAVILAGGPFRPFLERPELLTKVVVMSKQYVAAKKGEAAKAAPQPMPAAPSSASQRSARVVTARDVMPPSGPQKA